jgi:hypothetical protein
MSDMKSDAPRSPSTSNPQGTGSDTVSAANISAGTSVGNAGQPPMPREQRSDFGSSDRSSGSSTWSQGSGTAHGAGRSASSSGDLRERASGAMDQASDWARDQYDSGSRHLDQAREQSMRQFRQARGGIERFVSENPLMVGVMGLAAGLAIGALLPRTRQEDRAFGRWADEVRDQGMRYAREATQRGREYVDEALGSGDSGEDWHPDDEGGSGNIRSSSPRYQNH